MQPALCSPQSEKVRWMGSIRFPPSCSNPLFISPLCSPQVWHIACATLAEEKSLYLPYAQLERQQGRWKSIFFEQLFPARNKWGVSEGDGETPAIVSDFKIQVASRFRPGPRRKRWDKDEWTRR